jgi:hypothetical protein
MLQLLKRAGPVDGAVVGIFEQVLQRTLTSLTSPIFCAEEVTKSKDLINWHQAGEMVFNRSIGND